MLYLNYSLATQYRIIKANKSLLQNLSTPVALNTLLALGPLGRKKELDNHNTQKSPIVKRVKKVIVEENTKSTGSTSTTQVSCSWKKKFSSYIQLCILISPFLSLYNQYLLNSYYVRSTGKSKENKKDKWSCAPRAYNLVEEALLNE